MRSPSKLPPGLRQPALVQTLRWLMRPLPLLEQCHRRFGHRFTLKFMGLGAPTAVAFSRPDDVREIFTASPDVLSFGRANEVIRAFLGGRSLLLLDGDEHLAHRRLMMPSFHGDRMRAYAETMQDIADAEIDRWPDGRRFSLHESMQRITLDVIIRTVFGMDEPALLNEMRRTLGEGMKFATNPFLLIPALRFEGGGRLPWGRFLQYQRQADDLFRQRLAELRREGGTEGREDVLAMFVDARDEDGNQLSDEEIRDEMRTLLVAGHETTATALAWLFQCILPRPEVVSRLREELRSVTGGERVTPEQVGELEYLAAVIDESMRMHPVLPVTIRYAERPLTIGGLDVPQGVFVVPAIWLTHRDPELFDRPDEFRPERWLDGKPNPYELYPFGGGRRRCIGRAFALYEMKLVVARILSRVDLVAAPGASARAVRRGVTLAPADGTPALVERRLRVPR